MYFSTFFIMLMPLIGAAQLLEDVYTCNAFSANLDYFKR